ncbi:hypothetical protein CBR_g54234 [Chara braunii]|uniref:Uncharacterized protein n=1 Tax=Chara braunii TaxID=69332 RepID=A0A388K7B5_CHABU|nr:hypothetical protein CBR_g54234 [Chara braunii]|eukprot:GBG65942.1 hypothetical protein CBR_g54234 [Chara braunii]
MRGGIWIRDGEEGSESRNGEGEVGMRDVRNPKTTDVGIAEGEVAIEKLSGWGSRDAGGSLDSGRKTDDAGIGEGEVEVGMEREEDVEMGRGGRRVGMGGGSRDAGWTQERVEGSGWGGGSRDARGSLDSGWGGGVGESEWGGGSRDAGWARLEDR